MKKCCDITAGMLRTPVTFQRKTRTSDGAGGFTEAWAAITGAPTRAQVKAKSGSERWLSERTEASAQFTVTVRYFAGLLESDRIVSAGKAHNVRFINNVEQRNRWLVIDVTAGVAS